MIIEHYGIKYMLDCNCVEALTKLVTVYCMLTGTETVCLKRELAR